MNTTPTHEHLVTQLKASPKLADEEALHAFVHTYAASLGLTMPEGTFAVQSLANDWLRAYTGNLPFVLSAASQVKGGKKLTFRQLKGVLNCLRADPTGRGKLGAGRPPQSAASPAGPRRLTYSVDTGISLDIILANVPLTTAKRNGTVSCTVKDGKGRSYLVRKPGAGDWAGYVFVAGGTTTDDISKVSPYHLNKVGIQKPGETLKLVPEADADAVVAMVKTTFSLPTPPAQVSPAPVAPSPRREAAPEKAPEPKPEPEPVAAEPAEAAKPSGTSIRDLVRQRNGM